MPLEPGQVLAHYRLVEKIGEGGMGVVWKAEDTRLARAVAIKFLPDLFAGDPERLARFEREAKLLASLSHPNIAAIHGIEQAEGTRFLVLELVGGETLRERIDRGPLPLEDTLEVCGQIADALAAAHEQGILHRDLKPSNVKITPEGKVKVLDFGLAKAVEATPGDTSLTASPTLTTGGTQAGVIMGTASYMSPEQARGKAVDKRTDVWAFGCVLYECLSGRQVFAGETVTDILGAILHREPDWGQLPAGLPPALPRLIRRCLQRDARKRLHDMSDGRIILEEASLEPPPAAPVSRGPGLPALAAGAVLLLAAGIAAGMLLRGTGTGTAEPTGEIRFLVRPEIAPTTEAEASPGPLGFPFFVPPVALSPDGTRLVYTVADENGPRLYLRTLDRLEAEMIRGSEGAYSPFFSADGESVAFVVDGELRSVRVAGGTPRSLVSVGNFKGGTWTEDGRVLFAPTADTGIWAVPATGGDPVRLTEPDPERGERTHRFPDALPGGKAFLMTVGMATISTFNEANLAVWSEETGLRVLIEGGMCGRFVSPGHLVYVRNGDLYAVPFDPDALEVTGTPEMVLPEVASDVLTGAAAFSVSRTGTLAAVRGSHSEAYQLWSLDMQGNASLVREESDYFADLDVSPDGRYLALEVDGANSDIWIYDREREAMSRLTFEWNNLNPLWTPDGKRIAYTRGRAGTGDLFWRAADGSGEPELLLAGDVQKLPESFSPDGSALAYEEISPQTGRDIWILNVEDRTAEPFVQTDFDERLPVFSPDGRWIAYVSNESGREEVFVRPYPGPGGKWQVSIDGGTAPNWSPDGRSLWFASEGTLVGVDVTTEPGFEAGRPKPLFTVDLPVRGGDPLPDGSGFMVVVRQETPEPAAEIQVLVGWAAGNLPRR